MNVPSQKTLETAFDILGYPDAERVRVRELFKRRIAFELLKKVQGELPEEQRAFLESAAPMVADANHPMVAEMSKTLQSLHTIEEYDEMTEPIMKELVREYVSRAIRDGASAETADRLENLLR